MRRYIDRLVYIFFIVLAIILFKELLLSDEAIGEGFKELMSLLPFAEELSGPIHRILQCQYPVGLNGTGNVLEDLLRLVFMACLQPFFMWIAYLLFLRLPATISGVNAMEDYMDGFGYRLREALVNVVVSPLLAALSVWLIKLLLAWLQSVMGHTGGIIAGIGALIAGFGLSLIPLIVIGGGMAVGAAILYRLLIGFLPRVLEVFVTSTLCLAIYIAFVGGVRSKAIWLCVVLFVWLAVLSTGIRLMLSAVAGRNLAWQRGNR